MGGDVGAGVLRLGVDLCQLLLARLLTVKISHVLFRLGAHTRAVTAASVRAHDVFNVVAARRKRERQKLC